MITKVWMWRAWSAGRKRICDCGVVYAENKDAATSNARYCIGGPHVNEIDQIAVELIGTMDVEDETPLDVQSVSIFTTRTN